VLETQNNRNRPLNQRWVDKLSRDIKANAFITTHQGIAFSEGGELLDGQHRLAAIAVSGRAVQMLVTTGVPKLHRVNGVHLATWNAIDQGGMRLAGQMLKMDGIPNANRLAALARAMIAACCDDQKHISSSLPQIRLVLHAIGTSAETCVMKSNGGHKLFGPNGNILAAASLLHTKFPTETEMFLEEMVSITGSAGAPSRALVTWMKGHRGNMTSPTTKFKATAAALKAHMTQTPRLKIHASEEAFQWLLQQNMELVSKIRKIMDA
jgi:hypothetical protein